MCFRSQCVPSIHWRRPPNRRAKLVLKEQTGHTSSTMGSGAFKSRKALEAIPWVTKNDYQNNSKIILICNRTNKKLPGRKSCAELVTGNFENSKLFEGLVILNKKNRNLTTTDTNFILIFSCLFFRLVFSSSSSFILSFVLPSLVSRLSSPLLSLSVHSVCLSVSVSCGVCVREGVCCVGVVCCACWCVCGVFVCGVECGAAWHAEKTSVCRFKTSPCVPAPRAHVLPHAGVVLVHTGTF